ncbi:MAG: hypothetical protein ABSD42_04375 [Candidatus Bathyarchaeia archaeon]
MKKTIIAAILLTAIALMGLNFAGAFATAAPSNSPAAPQNTPKISVPPAAIIPIRSSWVRIDGNITSWGTQVTPAVSGALTVMAATTSLNGVPSAWIDSANAIWTNTTKISLDGTTTYNYYTARLIKANFTATDYQRNNFYMNGTWNVNNVTITRTVTKTDNSINIQSNTQITRLETKVYGQLNVTDSWTQFTLNITGIPLLDGTVHHTIERTTIFNRFDIINGGTDSTITRADLTAISNDYGAVPGTPNYNENMDFHGTYQIDICDIATIAANVQP